MNMALLEGAELAWKFGLERRLEKKEVSASKAI